MDLLILLAVLACPIVMGTMMLLMWRGMRGHQRDGVHEQAQPPQATTGDRKEVARR